MTDKMREEFEAWRLAKFCGGEERLKKCSNAPDVYYYTSEQAAWQAWQASRAALAVELPDSRSLSASGDPWSVRDWCKGAIEAAGVKVKP